MLHTGTSFLKFLYTLAKLCLVRFSSKNWCYLLMDQVIAARTFPPPAIKSVIALAFSEPPYSSKYG